METIFVSPGNPGIGFEKKVKCLGISDYQAVADFCRKEGVDLVVVGPDQALADGLVDLLDEQGVPAFGPTRAAARIEWSKSFAKEVMKNARIPTARYEVFAEAGAAKEFLTIWLGKILFPR